MKIRCTSRPPGRGVIVISFQQRLAVVIAVVDFVSCPPRQFAVIASSHKHEKMGSTRKNGVGDHLFISKHTVLIEKMNVCS
jgi:hypothetical protein